MALSPAVHSSRSSGPSAHLAAPA